MLIQHDKLIEISTSILEAAGAPADKARLVSEHLVEANLKGHDSHGIGMVSSYVRSMLAGLVDVNKDAELINDAGAVLSFDGGTGFGRVVGMQAIDIWVALGFLESVVVKLAWCRCTTLMWWDTIRWWWHTVVVIDASSLTHFVAPFPGMMEITLYWIWRLQPLLPERCALR